MRGNRNYWMELFSASLVFPVIIYVVLYFFSEFVKPFKFLDIPMVSAGVGLIMYLFVAMSGSSQNNNFAIRAPLFLLAFLSFSASSVFFLAIAIADGVLIFKLSFFICLSIFFSGVLSFLFFKANIPKFRTMSVLKATFAFPIMIFTFASIAWFTGIKTRHQNFIELFAKLGGTNFAMRVSAITYVMALFSFWFAAREIYCWADNTESKQLEAIKIIGVGFGIIGILISMIHLAMI